MSRSRLRPLPIVAGVLMVTGVALMLASLRIEVTRDSVDPTVAAAAPSPAAPVVAAGTPGASEPRAERLVSRARAAQSQLAYRGVKLVSHWSGGSTTTAVISVGHDPGHGTVVVAGDAIPSEVEISTTATAPLDASADPLDVLTKNYRLVTGPEGVVVGRRTDRVDALRADGSVAARYWIDRTTGLVLSREIVDVDGRVLESMRYTRILLGAPRTETAVPAASATAPPSPQVPRWTLLDTQEIGELRDQGWPLPERLAGGLELFAVHEQSGATDEVVQLGYTDGLVTISVFLQRGVLDRGRMDGYAALDVDGGEVWSRVQGAVPFYVWQAEVAATGPASAGADGGQGDIVASATTDSPSAPIAAVVAAIPAQPAPQVGVGDRLSRGVDRVTSWFDPQG